MAYIIPDSTIQFFADLGLSQSYDDTLYFASTSAKDAYFNNLVIKQVTSNSYTRKSRGVLKVQLPMSQLYNVTYLRFKNTQFENKWFYCFVTNVEYVNNITTEVTFEMDVIMTWMGTFSLGECYIERQHTVGDAIGANIASENLPVGNYICEGTDSTGTFNTYSVGFYKVYNPKKDSTPVQGVVQGIYVPLIASFYLQDNTVLSALSGRIADLVDDNRGDEIVNMKLVPSYWADLTNVNTPKVLVKSINKPYTSVNGYIPQNNKLFCYPYKYLSVENSEGKQNSYMYEYFNTLPDTESSGSASFTIEGTACTPEVAIMCTPRNYKGESHAYKEALSMQNFPNIAWNIDGYRAYIAQRDSTLFGDVFTSSMGGATQGAIGGAKGGVIGSVVGAVKGFVGGIMNSTANNVGDIVNDLASDVLGTPSRYPEELRGTPSSNIMAQARTKDFYFRQMCITKNYAMMIDDFFTMFGYAIRQSGTPNMNARPNWTYVKTKGCVVHGSLPASDATAIEAIFDKGVRFWKNHNNIGNYSLSNKPA